MARTSAAGVVVTGEAGIGKTRLVDAATADVRALQVTTLTGWCLQLSERLPLLPVLDVLRGLAAIDEEDLFRAAIADCLPYVRVVADQLIRFEPGRASGDEFGSGWNQQRTFAAVWQLLAAANTRQRLAIVIEDLQWCDRMTLDLLTYLLSPARSLTVPVVLTVRDDERSGEHELGWVSRLVNTGRLHRVALPRLSLGETAEQIAMLTGALPDPAEAAPIFQRSEGNPLYTEQLFNHLSGDAGRKSPNTGQVARLPEDLAELLMARISATTHPAQELITLLGVAGRPIDEDGVIALSGHQPDAVRGELVDLTRRRLISASPDGVFRLTHSLFGEVVVERMLPGSRKHIHGRLGDYLAGISNGALAAEAAEHYAAADRAADELRMRLLAARQAESRYASTEAAEHWCRALRLSKGPEAGSLPDGLSRVELYGLAQRALRVSGDTETADDMAQEAFRAEFDTASPAERGALYAQLANRQAFHSPRDALDLLHQAVACYQQGPPNSDLVTALASLALILNGNGRYQEAVKHAANAAALAADLGLHDQQRRMQAHLAWFQTTHGEPNAALEAAATLQDQLGPTGSPTTHMFVATTLTDAMLRSGQLDRVAATAEPALAAAAKHGLASTFLAAVLRLNVVEALTDLGRTSAAAQLIDPITKALPDQETHLDYVARARIDMLRGALATAERRWEAIEHSQVAQLEFRLEYARARAELHIWQRHPGLAFTTATTALAEIVATDISSICGQLLCLAARACAEIAEQARIDRDPSALDAAILKAQQLADIRKAMTIDPFASQSMDVAAPAYGVLWDAELRRSAGTADAEIWERTASAWQDLDRPHRAAYARWRQAEALLTQRHQHARAAPVLKDAARRADGHAPLLERIGALARRARIELSPQSVDPIPESPPSDRRQFGLTDRETAVLRLLAEGKTNAQIGKALFISPKTVSVHVTSILRRLGVSTRTHAAAVAERAGLLDMTDPANRRSPER